MSEDIFTTNAFCVLGLEVDATGQEVSRRAKEIDKLLQIGSIPSYELDLFPSETIRQREITARAAQKLSIINSRIREYFFWFSINDETDKVAYRYLVEGRIDKGIACWLDKYKKKEHEYTALRNLAISETMYVFSGKADENTLKESVSNWKIILNDDGFWIHFRDLYMLRDELGTDQKNIEGFRCEIESILSDLFYDITERIGNCRIFAEFASVFSTRSAKVREGILKPIFLTINDGIEKIQNLKVSWNEYEADQRVSDQTQADIASIQKQISIKTEELTDLSLWNDSEVIVLRDSVALAFRTLSIYINNEGIKRCKPDSLEANVKLAASLLDFALKISGTQSTKSLIEKDVSDLNAIKQNIKHLKQNIGLYKKLEAQMNKADFTGALDTIKEILRSPILDFDTRKQLEFVKSNLEIRLKQQPKKTNSGCYIATSVYGSYECPEVSVLRRFRDKVLKRSILGRNFIRVYYSISPVLVKYLGTNPCFRYLGKRVLDRWVALLKRKGFSEESYTDR